MPREYEEVLVCQAFGIGWIELQRQPSWWYDQAVTYVLTMQRIRREKRR